MDAVYSHIEKLGHHAIGIICELGSQVVFFSTAVFHIFTWPLKLHRIIQQLYFIGVKSLFVVCLVGIFTGMVLALQGYKTLVGFGSEGLLGAAVARSLIMELGPVLAALMVAGRAGSSMAAEIGIMRISEQIDALDTMDINPIKYLVSPRFAATVIAVPLLTAIFDVIGIFGGYLVGVQLLGVNQGIFFSSMTSAISMSDISSGLIKPLFFGFFIAAIGTYRGYYCDSLPGGGKGAKGVGMATTSAVVQTSVIVLVMDYVLTSFLF